MFQTSLELWRREQDRGTIKAEVVSRPQPTMVSPYTLLPGTTWRNSNNVEVAELLLQNKLLPASISNILANTFRGKSICKQPDVPNAHILQIFRPKLSEVFSLSLKRITAECRLCNRGIMQGLQIITVVLMMSCKANPPS